MVERRESESKKLILRFIITFILRCRSIITKQSKKIKKEIWFEEVGQVTAWF